MQFAVVLFAVLAVASAGTIYQTVPVHTVHTVQAVHTVPVVQTQRVVVVPKIKLVSAAKQAVYSFRAPSAKVLVPVHQTVAVHQVSSPVFVHHG